MAEHASCQPPPRPNRMSLLFVKLRERLICLAAHFVCRQEAGRGRCKKEARPCKERVSLLQSVSTAAHERRNSGEGPGYRAAAPTGQRDARVPVLLHTPRYSTCAGNATHLSRVAHPIAHHLQPMMVMFLAVTCIVSCVFHTVGGVALSGAASRGDKKGSRGPAEGTGKIFFLRFFFYFFLNISFLALWLVFDFFFCCCSLINELIYVFIGIYCFL